MALKEEILKNFFVTTTSNFKTFWDTDGEYLWSTTKIDGQSYTCMRHVDTVKIFNGIIHCKNFYTERCLIEIKL